MTEVRADERLRQILKQALLNLAQTHNVDEEFKKDFVLERPPTDKFGDFASNVAMVFCGVFKKNPLLFAEDIVQEIKEDAKGICEDISIVRPGFINFTFKKDVYENYLSFIDRRQIEGRLIGEKEKNNIKICVDVCECKSYGASSCWACERCCYWRCDIVGLCSLRI